MALMSLGVHSSLIRAAEDKIKIQSGFHIVKMERVAEKS